MTIDCTGFDNMSIEWATCTERAKKAETCKEFTELSPEWDLCMETAGQPSSWADGRVVAASATAVAGMAAWLATENAIHWTQNNKWTTYPGLKENANQLNILSRIALYGLMKTFECFNPIDETGFFRPENGQEVGSLVMAQDFLDFLRR